MKLKELRRELAELADALPPGQDDPLGVVIRQTKHRRVRRRGALVGVAVLVAVAIVFGLIVSRGGTSREVLVNPGPASMTRTDPTPCSSAAPSLSSPPTSAGVTVPRSRLLVPAMSTEARLCRYSGSYGAPPHSSLETQTLLGDAAKVEQLRSHLNALPTPTSRSYNCPADDGSAIVVLFNSGSTVTVALRGCRFATSPTGARWGSQASPELLALVPLPSDPPPTPPPTQVTTGVMSCARVPVAVTSDIAGGLTGGGRSVNLDLLALEPCVLDRMPRVAVLQADGAVVTDATAYQAAGQPQVPIAQPLLSPVLLAAGETAEITSYWYDVCASVTAPLKVRVTLADAPSLVVETSNQGAPQPPTCISSPTTFQRLPSGSLVLDSVHVLTTS